MIGHSELQKDRTLMNKTIGQSGKVKVTPAKNDFLPDVFGPTWIHADYFHAVFGLVPKVRLWERTVLAKLCFGGRVTVHRERSKSSKGTAPASHSCAYDMSNEVALD